MMRSWDARRDTTVCDEPLYARYLLHTGASHPGREEIIADGETDSGSLIKTLTGPAPDRCAIFYQKTHGPAPALR